MRWMSRLAFLGLALIWLAACAPTWALESGYAGEHRENAETADARPKLFQERQREKADRPVNWHTRFTFAGQVRPGPYTVDPHVWVYTKEFAERFGMPREWISDELKGVEAAAWRKTKTGYVTCGWGGKKEACKEEDASILELYFDTRMVKLPWAPWSRESDQLQLHWWGNSLRFLTTQACERRRGPSTGPLSVNWEDDRSCIYYAAKQPFSDAEGSGEVGVFVKGITYGEQGNMAGVGAYDKRTYPHLAWIQISLMPTMVNMGRPGEGVVISFEIRTAPLGKTLKVFHEIVLPEQFVGRMISAFKADQEKDRAFYKKALGME